MKTTKIERTARFFDDMSKLGFSYSEATALRRIELTLQRWAEAECNGDIERDETTERPFRRYGNYLTANDPRSIHYVPDREAGALKRLAKIMANHPELWSYHQGDPRGCALYVGRKEEITNPSEITEKARLAGAKLHLSEAGWVCLDMPNTPLWNAVFSTEEETAAEFLKFKGIKSPESKLEHLDSVYNLGFGVCI